MTNLDTLTGQLAGPRYRFGERVATAEGFELYAAMQSTLTRPVLIRIAREAGYEARDRLVELAQRSAEHDHLPIARTIEIGTFKGRAFLALSAGGAEPIAAFESRPELCAKLMESWGKSMLAALHQIHAAGLRIQEPEKQLWLLGADGRAWLLDAESIRTEGPRVNASHVVRGLLGPLAETSREALTALDLALSETPKPVSVPPPSPGLGASLWARAAADWRATPSRTLVLGGVAIALAVSAVLLDESASKMSPKRSATDRSVHYQLPRIHVTAVDPELTLARAAAERGQKYEALKAYRSVAERDAESVEGRDLRTLVSYLDLANDGTRSAEQSLARVGRRAEPELRAAFADASLSTYHRRRAGEVLERLGLRVDLVPLWVEALQSPRCSARRLAAAQLARSGDRRALAPLEALADKDGWFSSFCGAEDAELALERLSDRLDRS